MAQVKLTGPTWVGRQIRQAGEIVELPDKLAEHFGEVQGVKKVEAPVEAKPEETPVEVPAETPEEKPKKTKKSED